jgi:hypothetical protein
MRVRKLGRDRVERRTGVRPERGLVDRVEGARAGLRAAID